MAVLSTVQKATQSIKGNEVKGNMLQVKEQDKSPEPILMKHLSDKDFKIKVTKQCMNKVRVSTK